jgi:hypothetical protein
MLIIRDEQIRTMEGALARAFVDRLAGTLQSLFPVSVAELAQGPNGAEEYRQFVRRTVEDAENMRIDQESDIAAYAVLVIALSDAARQGDDSLEWTREILTTDDLPGAAKMALIHHRVAREAPEEPAAARLGDMLRKVRAERRA